MHLYLSNQADDLLFCYRWLLLEMKREFAFDDALRMLEVLWSSLPLNPPPASGLQLYEEVPYSVRAKASLDPTSNNITAPCIDHENKEVETKVCEEVRTEGEGTAGPSVKGKEKEKPPANTLPSTSPLGMRLPLRETPYSRLCALRRRTSSGRGLPDRQNQSLDDNIWGRRRLQRAEEQARMARPFFSLDESLTPVEADEMTEQEENKEKVENRVRPAPIQRQHQVVKNLNEFLNLARGRKEKQKEIKEVPKKEEAKKETRHSGDGAEEGSKFSSNKTSPDTESPTVEESSTEDDSAEYFPMTTSVTRELRLELESLDRQVFGEAKVRVPSLDMDDEDEDEEEAENNHEEETSGRSPKINTVTENVTVVTKCRDASKRGEGDGEDCFKDISPCKSQLQRAERIERYDRVVGGGGSGEEIFVWENPLQCPPTPDEQADLESDGGGGSPGSDDSESGNQGSYNGEVIEVVEAGGGTPGGGGVTVHVKSVTPIKLLRDLGNGPRARRTSSDSSDSSDAEVLPEDVSSEKPRMGADVGSVGGDGCLTTNSCEEVTEMTGLLVLSETERTPSRSGESTESRGSGVMELPPPHEFGGGNPFLMFLCLTLLRQQRDHVMRARMDANELAMHFDKMVRRHDVARVLNCARHMFAAYLRHHSAVAASTSPSDSSSGVRSGGEGCSPTSNYAEGGSELMA
ncbi:hypothetical protein J437_LFUL005438 [Ladona fulva]|uniref:Rab-GAP TBC domain-containing protein n=1 Tax=Ladona fulva TaxID=123851 RepID=A0A8K0JXC4_LADFU|nr:hypothetical protein J437_LFUL005438 [Ladona fulva]